MPYRRVPDFLEKYLMNNPLIRPVRPQTNMDLCGVTAYGVDLAVMLAKVLVAHGHIDAEPRALPELLAAGDAAVAKIDFLAPLPVACSAAEVIPVVTGLHRALAKLIEQHCPDSNEAEWLGESNELVVKLTGFDLSGNPVKAAQPQGGNECA